MTVFDTIVFEVVRGLGRGAINPIRSGGGL